MSTPQGPSNGPQEFPGQQPGHPGQPGSPQQPDQHFSEQQPEHQTGAPSEPKRSAFQKIKVILSVVALVIVGGITAWNWYSGQQRDKALTVGHCVQVTGSENEPKIEPADCDADGSEQVVVRVVEKHDRKAVCSDKMMQFEETSKRRRSSSEKTKTVCLAPVLQEGKLYLEDRSLMTELREVKSAEEADFKVAKVHDSADGSCGPEEHALVYSKWPRTYCLAEPM